MDPKALLQRITDAFADNDKEELFDALEDLECWLDLDGFMPLDMWLEFPIASQVYQEYIRELTFN